VVLTLFPSSIPVTATEKVHEAVEAIAPPDNFTVDTPETVPAVIVPPPQDPVSPLGLASARPLGKVSVNATPVRLPAALGFVMVNVRLVFPARGMLAAPNDFAIVGGENTVTVAFAVFPAPAVVEVTATLLFCTPAVVPVTFTEKVHEVLVGKVVPARLTTVAPEAAVIVPPPHEPVRPLGVDTTRPAGKVSLKLTPVSVVVVLLF